jgi:hypothetical protein
MVSRRLFLGNSLKLSAGLALSTAARSYSLTDTPVTFTMGSSPALHIPANFTGLGYEMSSVAPIGLLSAGNSRYVQLIGGLGATGVLRVGGIVADYTRYQPDGTIVAEPQNTVITRASIEQFAAFLKKIGWKAIWSVNFAQGRIEDAVQEARAVAEILGPTLLALEIGNEIENLARGSHPFRQAPYTYEIYRKEYQEWRAAILRALPQVSFAAPDTASSIEWVEQMAGDANGEIQLLTTHYYRNNQRNGSAEQLTYPDPKLRDTLTRLRVASQGSGIPWRVCETNSFSGGGRPGVSDSFLGALWTLDFMLLLASYGCSGVNIETGVNQLGFVSYYSPVQDDGRANNTAGAPYYGMLAFAVAQKSGSDLLPLSFDARGLNITAYLLGRGRKPRALVVINREADRDVPVSMEHLGLRSFTATRLQAPSPEAKSGITFAGSAVTSEGSWQPAAAEPVHGHEVMVPRMSAVVLCAPGQAR